MPRSPRVIIWILLLSIGAMAGVVSAGWWLRSCQLGTNDEKAREGWQRVPEIVGKLGIGEGSVVADIGAGGGFFTVRLARVVGSMGRVYAVDVDDDAVRDLTARLAREGYTNVEVIRGDAADPKLPVDALDGVLIVNAYHEMREYRQILEGIRRALRVGGRLVLVEPTAGERYLEPRESQARSHVISLGLVANDLVDAGFEVVERQENFVDRPSQPDEWLLVAKRAPEDPLP